MASISPTAVELRNLSKSFDGVMANANVNLRVQAGSIHGVIGENGAGKSTAMKMLYGMYRPDSGEILIHGKRFAWTSPAEAINAGLGMVHQHFMLAGPFTALENIIVGTEPVRWGLIDRLKALAQLESLARQYGLRVEWEKPVEELPVGVQQRIEILKLLYRRANILILDEPTAVLTPQETSDLFANLKKLRQEGKTIIIITHKLKEVMDFTDRVTVFRAGRVAGEVETARTTSQELANMMVGRKVSLSSEAPPGKPEAQAAMEISGLTLEASGSNRRHRLSGVSLSVKRGEIVGIAGVEGNGQTELLQAILHPTDPAHRTSGSVTILGEEVTGWDGSRIRDLGVAVIPEDRLEEGLLPERPVIENFLLGLQRSTEFSRAGFVRRTNLRTSAEQAIAAYDVRPGNLHLQAGGLSGGNQQKLIVAREFHRKPRLVIAAQPTRGVDVGAIQFIHEKIIRARDGGAGVLLVSSELEEVLGLSDRIVVMYEGRLVGEYGRGQVTERELGLKMGGS